MTGLVYIANVSAGSADYVVNDARIGTPGRPMNPKTRTPYFVVVSRSKYGDPPGTFRMGKNDFLVRFADTIPPEPPQINYTIDIPLDYSLDDDVILYVFRTSNLLLSARGKILPRDCTPSTGRSVGTRPR